MHYQIGGVRPEEEDALSKTTVEWQSALQMRASEIALIRLVRKNKVETREQQVAFTKVREFRLVSNTQENKDDGEEMVTQDMVENCVQVDPQEAVGS